MYAMLWRSRNCSSPASALRTDCMKWIAKKRALKGLRAVHGGPQQLLHIALYSSAP